MTLMPEVHDALRRAVAASPKRRRRPSRRVGLLALGGLVAGGTALAAATSGWHPQLGSNGRGPRPLPAHAGVPADQLAALAILRRPQTDADRGPLVRSALRVLSRDIVNGVHVDAIRVIFHTRREIAILIPVERSGDPRFPRTVTRNVLCLMSSSYQDARDWKITQHGKPKTVHLPAGFQGWGSRCGDSEALHTTGLTTGTSPDPSGGLILNGRPKHPTLRQVTLVPDGVARVTVNLRHRRRVTATVRDNVYRYTTHESPAQMGTVWFDAAGRRIDHRRDP